MAAVINAAPAGGLCQGVAFPYNMGRFGNSLAVWLGLRPAELFLYIFLPPMLLDASMRLDFFLFRKVSMLGIEFRNCLQLNRAYQAGMALQVLLHVMSFAFLVVGMSTAITTVVLIYVFDLRSRGWEWFHAALFSAMLASTDCVAVSSLLHASKVQLSDRCTKAVPVSR